MPSLKSYKLGLPVNFGFEDLISQGWNDLEELLSELQEWKDSLDNRGLGDSPKAQQLDEAIDILDGMKEPEVPIELQAWANEEGNKTSIKLWIPRRQRQTASREARCSNAEIMIQAAVDMLSGYIDNRSEEDSFDTTEFDDFKSELEDIVDEISSITFPDMMG